MLTLLKIKLMAALLSSHAMVSRAGPDTYAIPGHGVVHTKGCTISADRMEARVEDGERQWLHFYDSDGELEGSCEIQLGFIVVLPPRQPAPIPRSIATTLGGGW